MSDRPLALSVEDIRHAMLEGIIIPRDLVNGAINVLARKLTAKETKFFAFKGRVVQTHDVEAHGIQLDAADKILSLSGLYAREREAPVGPPTLAVEVTPDGVMRILVGAQGPVTTGSDVRSLTEAPPSIEWAPVTSSPAEPLVAKQKVDEALVPRSSRRVPIPPQVMRLIFDEEVE